MQMNLGSCRGRGLNPGGMKFGPTDPFLIQKLRFCELILLGVEVRRFGKRYIDVT